MAFSNLGFEDEDATAIGFPDVWTVALVATAEEAAGFDDGQTTPPDSPVPFESFGGGWSTNESYTFSYADPPDLAEIFPAFFDNALPDPEGLEDFEEGWSTNQNYLFAMGSITPASFDGAISLTSADGPFTGGTLGDTIEVTTDVGGPDVTDALAGTKASHQADSTSAGPPIGFDSGGETFRVYSNGRAVFTVTVDDTDLDVQDVGVAINQAATFAGFGGEQTAGIINPGGGFVLFIQSDVEGYNSQIQVENVSHADTLQRIGFSAAQIRTVAAPTNGSVGTGNVALIDEIPASDLAALVNTDAGILALGAGAVTTPSGGFRLTPDPGGQIKIDNGTGTLVSSMGPWVNSNSIVTYIIGITGLVGPVADIPENVEDFEEGWDNGLAADYYFTWADVEALAGTDPAEFDTGPAIEVEDFERQWRSNESFAFVMGGTTGAVFDVGTGGASEAVEDFEEVNALGVVVVNVGTDTFTKTAHGMALNQIVTFENEGGALPGGLNSGTNYFLISVVANTFQVSATLGGAAVDILDAGTGTQRVRPDVATFWTSLMATL